MTATKPPATKLLTYPEKSMERARRALKCSPFQMPLFATMRGKSVQLGEIADLAGVKQKYTRNPLSELAVEAALMWLIQVGVLRREVDGQGITDSFRLTPLGHQIIEQWQAQGGVVPRATLSDRIYNAISRWLRFF